MGNKAKTSASERSGLRSRYRDVERYEQRHRWDCRCEKHHRPERVPGGEDREKYPEKQHVPFLSLWIRDMPAVVDQLSRSVAVTVELKNNGNAASFTPMVELFLQRGPSEIWRGGSAQLSPVYPHSTVNGTVGWSWQMLKPIDNSLHLSITATERFLWAGYLTAVCYDPGLDPKPPAPFDPWGQASHHRKVLTMPYWTDVNGP